MVTRLDLWPAELARRFGCHLKDNAAEMGRTGEDQRHIERLGTLLKDAADSGAEQIYVTVSDARMLSK